LMVANMAPPPGYTGGNSYASPLKARRMDMTNAC
jgi:hypothetical protein